MDTTITTLEMCAGYGGIGLGIKNIFGERLRTIAYCELEGFAQANLISKMEKGLLDAAPIWSDLKTFPYESFHGLVDILIAGYPCQPFSSAGKRAGKDDPRHLWPWIADGIRLLRPRVCFFENVEGHISLGLSTVISDLEELGYKVSWGIFSASVDAGAPHQRKRVFILAHLRSKGLEGSTGKILQRDIYGFASNGSTSWPSRPGELAHADQRGQSLGVNAGSCIAADSGGQGHSVTPCGVWPSRPGEPQHGWEPPRVVDTSSSRQQAQRDESVSEWQEGFAGEPSGGNAEAMGNPSSQRCEQAECDVRGEQQASWIAEECGLGVAEAMGNSTSERPHRGGEDGLGLQPEMLGERYEAMGDSNCINWSASAKRRKHDSETGSSSMRQVEPSLGRDSDGSANRMDYAELCVSCDNRTDELRLLGNGVVPATATRAFLTLMEELNK